MKINCCWEFLSVGVFILISSCITGCSSVGSYSSAEVYSKALYGKNEKKAINYEGVRRNPVIVIHGFLGSKLKNNKTGDIVWGYFKGIDSIIDFPPEYMRTLAVPMNYGEPLKNLKDDVVPAGILDQVTIRLLGGKFNIDGYDKLLKILTDAGYVEEGKPLPKDKNLYSLFVFSYDWRQDLPQSAAKLHEFIVKKRAYVQKEYERLYGIKNYDVQFDVVAHSMGGLLTRYYLRYGNQDLPKDGSLPQLDWRGSKHLDKIFIVGTPNAGYLDTCVELVRGLQMVTGGPVYPPALIGTFPSYYQMLPLAKRSVVYADAPTTSDLNVFDPQVWIDMKWGLADPNQDENLKKLLPNAKTKEERRRIALDHQKKCLKRAKQFTDSMRIKSAPPEDVILYLFLGDAVKTRRTVAADRKTGRLKTIEYVPGDGKVASSSARFDGVIETPLIFSPIYWTSIMHLRAAHMGVISSESFAHNATFMLLTLPSLNQRLKYKNKELPRSH
jgi:hypothetical protein